MAFKMGLQGVGPKTGHSFALNMYRISIAIRVLGNSGTAEARIPTRARDDIEKWAYRESEKMDIILP